MIRIILIRHAKTIDNEKGIAQSLQDSHLSDEGIEQVKKISEFLKNYDISAIFTSKLGRTIKTAEAIAKIKKLKIITDERLNEINWGKYTGLATKDLFSRWEKHYKEELNKGVPKEEIRPPDGENTYDHIKRIKSFLNDLISNYRDKTVLIVGHGGSNKVLIGLLQGTKPEDYYEIKQDNACINILELTESKLTSAKINITNHLE